MKKLIGILLLVMVCIVADARVEKVCGPWYAGPSVWTTDGYRQYRCRDCTERTGIDVDIDANGNTTLLETSPTQYYTECVQLAD